MPRVRGGDTWGAGLKAKPPASLWQLHFASQRGLTLETEFWPSRTAEIGRFVVSPRPVFRISCAFGGLVLTTKPAAGPGTLPANANVGQRSRPWATPWRGAAPHTHLVQRSPCTTRRPCTRPARLPDPAAESARLRHLRRHVVTMSARFCVLAGCTSARGASDTSDKLSRPAAALVSIAYTAALRDGVACVRVHQQFHCIGDAVARAVYEFALPPAAVVVGVRASLDDGRTLTATLREKGEVRGVAWRAAAAPCWPARPGRGAICTPQFDLSSRVFPHHLTHVPVTFVRVRRPARSTRPPPRRIVRQPCCTRRRRTSLGLSWAPCPPTPRSR